MYNDFLSDNFCKGLEHGSYYCHPSDPTSYIQCIWDDVKIAQCTSPLVWNQKSKACDWEANVKDSYCNPSAGENNSS